MKYLAILLLVLSGCSTPSYIVWKDKCDDVGGNALYCKQKGSVQKLK